MASAPAPPRPRRRSRLNAGEKALHACSAVVRVRRETPASDCPAERSHRRRPVRARCRCGTGSLQGRLQNGEADLRRGREDVVRRRQGRLRPRAIGSGAEILQAGRTRGARRRQGRLQDRQARLCDRLRRRCTHDDHAPGRAHDHDQPRRRHHDDEHQPRGRHDDHVDAPRPDVRRPGGGGGARHHQRPRCRAREPVPLQQRHVPARTRSGARAPLLQRRDGRHRPGLGRQVPLHAQRGAREPG